MRTRLGRSALRSPFTSATNSSVETSERKPIMRNSPVSVGSRASATRSIVFFGNATVSRELISLSAIVFSLKRLQILDEIRLLLLTQVCAEETVVVLDHVAQRRETTVVIKAALRVCPESFE